MVMNEWNEEEKKEHNGKNKVSGSLVPFFLPSDPGTMFGKASTAAPATDGQRSRTPPFLLLSDSTCQERLQKMENGALGA